MDDVTLVHIVLANLALLAGACLQGVAGYGIGTLAAPLLFLISPVLLPAPLILNAVVLTVLPEAFRGFESYRMVIYSLALILIMIYRPQGILGRNTA